MIFSDFNEIFTSRFIQDGVLPPVLYVQMDNCWRENKNQFLLAFFAFLVLKRIVKKVYKYNNTHQDLNIV